MKVKIGTQMEERVFRALKIAAAREGKSVGTLVEEAVAEYIGRPKGGNASGLRRFLERQRRPVSAKAMREVLEADFYEQ